MRRVGCSFRRVRGDEGDVRAHHQVQELFLGLAAILVLARVLGMMAARLGQPPVIGEIVAGIAMGPTLFHGQIASTLFPTEIRPLLAALANVGLALFMFIVGCELEHATVVERKLVPISVSIGSTALPFLLGSGLGLYLYSAHGAHGRAGSASCCSSRPRCR